MAKHILTEPAQPMMSPLIEEHGIISADLRYKVRIEIKHEHRGPIFYGLIKD